MSQPNWSHPTITFNYHLSPFFSNLNRPRCQGTDLRVAATWTEDAEPVWEAEPHSHNWPGVQLYRAHPDSYIQRERLRSHSKSHFIEEALMLIL